jgi:ankyrin repeat protein
MIDSAYQLHNTLDTAANRDRSAAERRAALDEAIAYIDSNPARIRDQSHQEKSKIFRAAIAVGDVDFLLKVISRGVNIESKSEGDPVAFAAFANGDVAIAKALVESGFATPIGEKSNVLLMAIKSHNHEMIRYVLETFDSDELIKGLPVASVSSAFLDVDVEILMARSVDEHMRCIDVLVEYGVRPDAGWLAGLSSMFGFASRVTKYAFTSLGDHTVDDWRERFSEFADRTMDMLAGYIGDDAGMVSRIRGSGILYGCLALGMTRRAQWLVDNGMSKYDQMKSGESWLDCALSRSKDTMYHEDSDGKLPSVLPHERALESGLTLGVDVNRRSNSGETPLTKLVGDLCSKNHTYLRPDHIAAFLRKLPSYGFDFNAKSMDGRAPLLMAAMKPDGFMLELLSDLGCDVKCKSLNGASLLHTFCLANSGGGSFGARQVIADAKAIISNMVLRGADPNEPNAVGVSPLHDRIDLGDMRTLVEVGADVNLHCQNLGWTPLQYVARAFTSPDKVTLLLDRGADVFLADKSGLSLADQAREGALIASVGNIVMAEIVARTGELQDFVYSDGSRIIHKAVNGREHWALSRIKDIWGDVDVKNSDGLTPLHLAVSCGDEFAVKTLLDMGADPNLASPVGATALHMAVNKDFTDAPNLEVVKILVTHGADAGLKYKGRAVASMRKDEQLARILRSSAMGSSIESALSGGMEEWPHAPPSKVDFGGVL